MQGPLRARGGMIAFTREPSLTWRQPSESFHQFAALRRDYPLYCRKHCLRAAETNLCSTELACFLNVNVVIVIHHDFRDVRIGQKILYRSQTNGLIQNYLLINREKCPLVSHHRERPLLALPGHPLIP
ncbi:MAG: hypothetical protein CM15mP74_03440 [Halieaceae bacterium]|nr:MAG: hypothetical protein CM15mP74_03440 [Halieaceae bacterium]